MKEIEFDPEAVKYALERGITSLVQVREPCEKCGSREHTSQEDFENFGWGSVTFCRSCGHVQGRWKNQTLYMLKLDKSRRVRSHLCCGDWTFAHKLVRVEPVKNEKTGLFDLMEVKEE